MTNDVPWLNAEEDRSWRAFVRLHQKLFRRLGADLETHSGLSGADFQILVALTDVPEGRLRFQDLAGAIDWERSRLSHQVSRMIKRGLVAREECAEDGRGAFVVITPQGREAIEAAAPRHLVVVRRLVIDALDPEDLAALGRISSRVLERIDAEPR
ncbi:MarR family winged helix-turn-helix transcriptional regulator [Myceligenerans pegani]|uniref:Winged helix-turn-helix transcriptional regulator n=1 Tax=Myceligenerans pegani TaxID=2776917 RepID=A0ABR9MX66_9MICO|nr:MarR family winged helix-turn-helix transcriptional regulator [Myceligenerans sp. TRM 65318]MBE1875651.1 winged helix-turn-helix transcriptional regulator [Myceligenerans sp. TRM 65318]MBE3017922.1 winged helix-turn-helix transcriptional regulator [Myceligenerans sp. TRM 65318]